MDAKMIPKLITIAMTREEWTALAEFLEILSDYQSSSGCNDLPKHIANIFTENTGNLLAAEYAIYNNPAKPESPDWPLPDSCLLALLKYKIQKQISQ